MCVGTTILNLGRRENLLRLPEFLLHIFCPYPTLYYIIILLLIIIIIIIIIIALQELAMVCGLLQGNQHRSIIRVIYQLDAIFVGK